MCKEQGKRQEMRRVVQLSAAAWAFVFVGESEEPKVFLLSSGHGKERML
jgi:hypothetical protein